jgi:hypothetical protein
MNAAADIIEQTDPRIAVAEMWLCMLGGLREIAKRFSRFLVYEIMPFGPCPNGRVLAFRGERDPVAAMKRVTRALRFAAVLYLKIQEQIAAWKAGVPFDLDRFLAEAPPVSARAKSRAGTADSDEEDWDEEEYENLDEFENLVEREAPERFDVLERWDRPLKEDKYQALLRGPLKDAIKAICDDLGLAPDWSLWTEKGFPAPRAGEIEDWVAYFVPEAIFAPRPGPGGSPVDDAAYKIWRRRWCPSHPYGRAPPLHAASRSPPYPRGSP